MIRIERLPSGCRVVTEVIPGARSVALGVMVAAGSRHEDRASHGAAHLLEHLLFRGAEGYDGARLADLLDRMGGESNAVTDKEVMTAYVRTLPEEADEAMRLLGAVVTSPTIAPEVLDAERAVVLDEMLARDDEGGDLASTAFDAVCFGDHPLGRDVLGSSETLRSLEADAVRRFHRSTYGSDRTVVVATGAVDHDRLVEMASTTIRPMPKGEIASEPVPPARRGLEVLDHDGGQVHVLLGVRSSGMLDEDRLATVVLSHLLGGGVSSRLFRTVRDDHGLAYGVGSDLSSYREAGSLCTYAACAPANMTQVIDLLATALDDLSEGRIDAEEVERSKASLRADILLAADEPLSRLGRLGVDVLFRGFPRSTEDALDDLHAVDLDAVRAAARRVGASDRQGVLVGPAPTGAIRSLERAVG